MALHAVGAADHQNRVIENGQHAFGLAGKIHVARRIGQHEIKIVKRQNGLFGKNCNAALFFLSFRIKKSVLTVHAA